MTDSRLDEEAIFGVARKIDGDAERAEYLRQTCGDDQVLFDRVATLLRMHTEESGFLESPVVSLGPAPDMAAVSERPGAVIGPYKLLEQIGSGGMGLVFMAEQQQPMRRLVALKIIKPGMDTRQVIGRFEAERQALALMDHPNIAKVLDAGATNSGRPYFVMELVRGIPVTDYCDQARLPARERLQLFITVCEAVQHAHQKGIIHRDIKPSNILVTMHDDKAVPKVIDFGVAKATNQRLVEQTLFTNFAQMIGTPTYMSPEQAQMSGLDVDTRSDIYSLGVLLYELLTGSTPFDKNRLHEAGYDELRRIIRDEEPPRPSARVTSFDAASQSTIAGNRTIDRRKFSQALRGDLDWIVMKALEKDRTRRYESVSGLIADVRRYLADEPVEACPPSAGYRLRKFARRRKRLFAFLSLFAGFLVISVVGLATGYVLISHERTEVLRQRNIAQVNERKVVEREGTIRRYLYAADVQLAWSAYAMGDGKQAREKLLSHRPASHGADNRGFEWYHLWNLCVDEPRVYRGHSRDVFGLAFSSNGNRLVSTSADRTVVVWNVTDGTHTTLRDFTDDVNGAIFSADGNLLATSEESKMVRVWEPQTGREIARLVGFEQPAARVFFTADQRSLIATEVNWETHQAKISLWDLATQKRQKLINGYCALAVDAGAKLLAAGSAEGELSLWTLPELELRFSWQGHHDQVLCAAFAAGGESLATASRGGDIGLWRLTDYSGRKFAADRPLPIRHLAFLRDDRLLVSVGDDAAALIWDTRSGTIQKVLEGTHGRSWSVDASPDGAYFAIGCADGTIEMRDVSEMTTSPQRIHESPQSFRGAALDAAGARLAVIDADDRFVSILDLKTGDLLKRLAEPDGEKILAIAFAADDRWLWTGNIRGTIQQLDSATGESRQHIALHTDGIEAIYVSPAGRYLATNATWSDRTGKVWDTEAARTILTLTDSGDARLPRLNFVRGFLSESIVFISRDRTMTLWDLETDRELPPTFPRVDWLTGLAASPDGTTLATGSVDFAVHLWDLVSGRETLTMRGHRTRFTVPAFSPDGRTLATASDTGELKLWHLPTAQFLYDLHGHTGGIRFLAFSRDGTRLISAGNMIPGDSRAGGSEVLVWDGFAVKANDRRAAGVGNAPK